MYLNTSNIRVKLYVCKYKCVDPPTLVLSSLHYKLEPAIHHTRRDTNVCNDYIRPPTALLNHPSEL